MLLYTLSLTYQCESVVIHSEPYLLAHSLTLLPQNGFWWSLGFCAVLFIPIIVFLVLTSNYYLKKGSDVEATGGYSSYEDYP